MTQSREIWTRLWPFKTVCHCCTGAKVFVWLDSMLHHRVYPTNAVDNSRLDHYGEYMLRHWPRYVGTWFSSPPSNPHFSGKVGLNPALGLVTSCCSCQTAWWRPACCWLGWGSMIIGYPSKRHYEPDEIKQDENGQNMSNVHKPAIHDKYN